MQSTNLGRGKTFMIRIMFRSIARLGKIAVVAICCAMLSGVLACNPAAGDTRESKACSPFGSEPAQKISAVKPNCGTGALLGPWQDSDRTDRYACLYQPAVVTPDRKLPMIVYIHPSLFSAGWITVTNLLSLQDHVSISKEPEADGYIVLAPEGRKTTHYYPFPDNHGIGWDNWYRQLDPKGDVKIGDTIYPENVDAAAIDHFIQEQVATGKVDSNRIYVTGWSNGAAMAYLYALNRPNIAAVAVYSAPNPFGAFDDPCPQTPQVTVTDVAADNKQLRIFNPNIPTMHIHNSCDIGGICPNSERLTTQLKAIGVAVDDVMLDNDGHRVNACMDYCGTNSNGGLSGLTNPWGSAVGLKNHMLWPKEWTPKMVEFFRAHPLGGAH